MENIYISAVIAAGGKGSRMGASKNKVYLELEGIEVIARTVSVFEKNRNTDEIIIVTGKDDIEIFEELAVKYKFHKIRAVVCGGKTRAESVVKGLEKVNGEIVLIHDGARALITDAEINAVIEDCRKFGAAALGVRCKDTLKSADDKGFIASTIDRESTYMIQTPQAFFADDIKNAYQSVNNLNLTDDCAVAEKAGIKIKITEGSSENIKLTTPSDMAVGAEIIRRRSQSTPQR